MNFDLSAEQSGIRDSLRRFISKSYGFEQRRTLARQKSYSSEAWSTYAELGILALPFPEEVGGLGGSGVDVMLVMESFGEGLLLEPYVSTIVLCGGLLTQVSGEHADILCDIIEGRRHLAFAGFEPDGRYTASCVTTRAEALSNQWHLNGRKSMVYDSPFADTFVVSARVGGGVTDRDGIALFVVDAHAPGVEVRPYGTHDGSTAAEIVLKNVRVDSTALVGTVGEAMPLIEKALDRTVAAQCAEAVGIMASLKEQTIQHLQTRKQFGQPIGKFQALRHRVAEMAVQLEQARAMALLAAVYVDCDDAALRASTVSGAKAFVSRCARFVGQEAVQLHGGMGLTDELAIGHGFKRLTMLEAAYGDSDYHLARYSDAFYASGQA